VGEATRHPRLLALRRLSASFARPIHSLVAFLGSMVNREPHRGAGYFSFALFLLFHYYENIASLIAAGPPAAARRAHGIERLSHHRGEDQ